MALKEKMNHGRIIGAIIKVTTNPCINIFAKNAGLDFLLYDCEHGMIPFEKLHDLILMGNAIEIPSIVRVPELCRSEVSKALDCGATGVMVPMVETREEAMRMVDWSKYPPHGKRGYSGGANTGYKPSGGHKKIWKSSIRE